MSTKQLFVLSPKKKKKKEKIKEGELSFVKKFQTFFSISSLRIPCKSRNFGKKKVFKVKGVDLQKGP